MVLTKRSGVIIAGMALFSMFFGAGDLIWPLILGGNTGDRSFSALLGLWISGVSLPLLGLLAMILFQGDYRAFFGQMGKIPALILIFIIQAILGPFGSLPRLITLTYATLHPYMSAMITLPVFSILSVILLFFFTIKKNRVIDLLGAVLCPVLLVALGAILVLGFFYPAHALPSDLTHQKAFFSGLNVGYNTLDLIASFIFAPLVMTYFYKGEGKISLEDRKTIFRKSVKSSLFAAFLLASMYFGLTTISASLTPLLPAHAPEARLAAISYFLLGPYGALFSCVAVALSCLTTAIPISIITASYIHEDVLKKRMGKSGLAIGAIVSLGTSMLMANLGFMGIAEALSPILQILCPGLIILCLLNILHKLYEMRMKKSPVFLAFALSMIGYFIRG